MKPEKVWRLEKKWISTEDNSGVRLYSHRYAEIPFRHSKERLVSAQKCTWLDALWIFANVTKCPECSAKFFSRARGLVRISFLWLVFSSQNKFVAFCVKLLLHDWRVQLPKNCGTVSMWKWNMKIRYRISWYKGHIFTVKSWRFEPSLWRRINTLKRHLCNILTSGGYRGGVTKRKADAHPAPPHPVMICGFLTEINILRKKREKEKSMRRGWRHFLVVHHILRKILHSSNPRSLRGGEMGWKTLWRRLDPSLFYSLFDTNFSHFMKSMVSPDITKHNFLFCLLWGTKLIFFNIGAIEIRKSQNMK